MKEKIKMNRGLKSYTKQLTETVGNAGSVNINLNNDDANLIMTLPLLSSIGNNAPINLSLIYNHQNKDETGIFGKGIRLNLYSRLLRRYGEYIVVNSDGSQDSYSTKESENPETGSKIIYYEETNSASEYEELVEIFDSL